MNANFVLIVELLNSTFCRGSFFIRT